MKLSFGQIELTAGAASSSLEHPAGPSYRILILGDFSGRASRNVVLPLADRKPVPVDRDNFDTLPDKLGTALNLTLPGDLRVPISFAEVDDFHPDRLYQRLDVFRALRELRSQLGNPATFAQAAGQLRSWQRPTAEPAPAPAPSPSIKPENLLEDMLGEAKPEAATGASDWNTFLRRIVEPNLVSSRDLKSQAELIELVDQIIGHQLRIILHHADFQALESAWKGLQLLVRRLDSDGPLRLFLLDVSRAELAADLLSHEDLARSSLYRLLVEQPLKTPGGQPWAVLAGCYAFGPSDDDAVLLGRLAKLTRRSGAKFLAAALPALAGCRSFAESTDPADWQPVSSEAWQELRQLPEAAALHLVAPRFLLRQPYGKDTDPIESLPFEELPAGDHEAFLWGNPALAVTCLLGQEFLRRQRTVELDNLPLYVRDGEIVPCSEAWLGERAAEALADRGIMALLSVRSQPAIQLHSWRALGGAS